MKVLLDECVDEYLAREQSGHQATTVGKIGWSGLKNGQLLRRAVAEGFEAFVTTDRNLSFQNNIATVELAVFVLRSRSNNWIDLKPLLPQLLEAMVVAEPRTVTFIGP